MAGRACIRWAMAILVTACLGVAAVPGAEADDPIQVTFSPLPPLVSEPVTMTFTGTSDTPRKLYVFIYDYVQYQASGGGVCLGTDPIVNRNAGEYLVVDAPVAGAFSVPVTTTFPDDENYLNGDYTFCAWLADSRLSPATTARERIQFHVSRPPAPPTLSTRVQSAYRLDEHRPRLAVSARIIASGRTPKGSCVLEVQTSHQWLYATSYVPVDAHGRCRISFRIARPGRVRFRVVFRPAVGFHPSIGAPASVVAPARAGHSS